MPKACLQLPMFSHYAPPPRSIQLPVVGQQTDPSVMSEFSCSSNPSGARQLGLIKPLINTQALTPGTFKKIYLLFRYVCVCVLLTCMHVCNMCAWCLWRSGVGVRSPGSGVIHGCEPSLVAGDQTLVHSARAASTSFQPLSNPFIHLEKDFF